jgi:hypothetical protein
LTAAGETAVVAGVGFKNGSYVNRVRSLGGGSLAVFPFTSSTATFTVVAINSLGASEPSDSFTLASLPGGTAVQQVSDISAFTTYEVLE